MSVEYTIEKLLQVMRNVFSLVNECLSKKSAYNKEEGTILFQPNKDRAEHYSHRQVFIDFSYLSRIVVHSCTQISVHTEEEVNTNSMVGPILYDTVKGTES